MKRIMLVFGTRPEAIKMCPLVNELKTRVGIETIVCVTGQHRQMLDQVLQAFNVVPDFDLSIMKQKQNLFDITGNILSQIPEILKKSKPDIVLVHGDTTTSFATALACFYLGIPVGHVEAGLRTYNIDSPYPEEFNRQAVDSISRYCFSPTELSRDNLLREGKNASSVFVTGNTAIDALKTTVRKDYTHPELEWAKGSKLILITAHRRENLGEPMRHMFRAIRRVLNERNDVKAIYPIHLNPLVRENARLIFADNDRIHLIEPLDVLDFHNFLNRSYLILTDSGGIQEEVHVGSLHVDLDIVRLVLISKLILSESLSPFFLVTQVIALEDIVVGVGRVPLECVVGLLLNLFCISVSAGIVVSIGNCDSKL